MIELKNILLIEDDFNLNETISFFLEAKGYNVDRSLNGRGGVELLQTARTPYDLILCDINLPDILGYDVYKMARKVVKTFPKFIFLTAYADKVFIDDARQLGVDDYVTKPFAFDGLLAVLEKHLAL